LSQLFLNLPSGSLSVFFRNNHFNTLYKRGNSLYILITDQGYLNNEDIVWEEMVGIDGDSLLFNSYFSNDSRKEMFVPFVIKEEQEQIDQDFALALQLQERPMTPSLPMTENAVSQANMSTQKQTTSKGDKIKKKKSCIII
jgi:hypothetical protein